MKQQIIRFAQKGLILNKSRNKLLVIRYLKSTYLPEKLENKLALPGGQMDFGEQPDESFIREIREETGIRVHPAEVIYTWTWVYTKGDVIKQIIANARIGIENGGKLLTQNRVESEVTISKPFWIDLNSIAIDDFVMDERPAIEQLLARI